MNETLHLKDRLEHDLKDAMRAQDRVRLAAIRSLLAAITTREKEAGKTLSVEELRAVVQKQAKQRRDSIEQYRQAGRMDLVQREVDELTLIERYLPRQLSDAEVRNVIQEIVTRTGASSRKDLGRVMSEAMHALRGQADGSRVRAAAESLLAG